jgi:hypothetical protein
LSGKRLTYGALTNAPYAGFNPRFHQLIAQARKPILIFVSFLKFFHGEVSVLDYTLSNKGGNSASEKAYQEK